MMPHTDPRHSPAPLDAPLDATASDSADPVFSGPVMELDVRDDLRNRREPFSKIMAAVEALRDGEVLHLRATFEPVPLFRALGKRGLEHVARERASDDWSVWFHRPGDGPIHPIAAPATPAESSDVAPRAASREAPREPLPGASPGTAPAAAAEIVLDVRGLEPPEPMTRTLAALESLPHGAVLVQLNVRVPQFLLPILSERGFQYEVDESASDAVVVRISRAG